MVFKPEEYTLHTHSFYCGHGNGEPIEFARVADKSGIRLIGMSEHLPLPDNRWSKSRMPFAMLDEYVSVCKSLKRMEDLPTVLRGFECDFDPCYADYYKNYILSEGRAEYLICAVHYIDSELKGKDTNIFFYDMTSKDVRIYADMYIKGLESGIFLFGAHPDLYLAAYRKWDSEAKAVAEDITQCAKQYGLPLEINGNGMRRGKITADNKERYLYPVEDFWEIAVRNGTGIIANADAHIPAYVAEHCLTEIQFAKENGYPLKSIDYTDGKILFI